MVFMDVREPSQQRAIASCDQSHRPDHSSSLSSLQSTLQNERDTKTSAYPWAQRLTRIVKVSKFPATVLGRDGALLTIAIVVGTNLAPGELWKHSRRRQMRLYITTSSPCTPFRCQ